MKRRQDERGDAFDVAWVAFVDEDRRTAPRAGLEARIVEAARVVLGEPVAPRRKVRARWKVGVGMAAAAMLAIVIGARMLRSPIDESRPPELRRVPVALTTLAADPILETESLQLVRVRLPRAALGAFGVALAGPDSGDIVDVDVLVGDDGLAREIRRIQPVLDTATQN
jgi:hypothetical protein